MLANARRRDPEGRYLRCGDGDLGCLRGLRFDFILSAFPISSTAKVSKVRSLLEGLKGLLAPAGRLVLIEATDVLYRNEWVSFTTADFPENAAAKSGDPVQVYYREHRTNPVTDILWCDADYRQRFREVGLWPLEVQRPLAREEEPGPWISEREIPPWVIYVLAPLGAQDSEMAGGGSCRS